MFFHRSDDDAPKAAPKTYPVLPLRDIVVFPHMVVPLFVGREKSVRALEHAMNGEKTIVLIAQKNAKTNDPTPDDLFSVGAVATISRMLRLADGTVKVLVEGQQRVRIQGLAIQDGFYQCEAEVLEQSVPPESTELASQLKEGFDGYARVNKRVPPETIAQVAALTEPARIADTVAVHLTSMKLHERQDVLETLDVHERLEKLVTLLDAELEILNVEKKIRSRVKKQMEKTQKEYYLNEQMSAIQKELGERDEFKNELQELEDQAAKKALSQEADEKVKKELRKLRMMQPMGAEATVVRNYLDWVLALPWGDKSEENYDIDHAEKVLDEDHYGLRKIKERILEYLAVQALVKKLRGPVLCLVGPPGVGKTSLAKSIAHATGRKFVRLALGGVRDEAEIRGHRRTYIGALPGRLIQSLKKAGTNNPVFLLDEIDKMSSDFRGDPASALLEVLDPEQNKTFNDHYLDLDYDLSEVMFITTANSLSGIPVPLRDRMEIIELSGYTEFEKLNIAVKYLVPRQREEAGLADLKVEFTEAAIRTVIHYYTKESGVRNLERELGSICRKIARRVLKEGREIEYKVEAKDVPTYLGVPKYSSQKTGERDEIGLTNGLAYTSVGGTLLECEVTVVPGKGNLVITGLLEKGMQESAQAALSYIRSRQKLLGLEEDFHSKVDVHVHFPEFVPKDGPSAGVTIATTIASALMKIPVRRSVAMTGEITLRGRVMPIGGLKEKMLAAHRAGVTTVLIPKENRKDLREIPRRVLESTRVVLVEHMDQVLYEALVLNDPDAIFGQRERPAELVEGRFRDPSTERTSPAPNAPGPGAQQ